MHDPHPAARQEPSPSRKHSLVHPTVEVYRFTNDIRNELEITKDYAAPAKPGYSVGVEPAQRVLRTMDRSRYAVPLSGLEGMDTAVYARGDQSGCSAG